MKEESTKDDVDKKPAGKKNPLLLVQLPTGTMYLSEELPPLHSAAAAGGDDDNYDMESTPATAKDRPRRAFST